MSYFHLQEKSINRQKWEEFGNTRRLKVCYSFVADRKRPASFIELDPLEVHMPSVVDVNVLDSTSLTPPMIANRAH